jgi:nitrate/TMAO reductase-like tetraheme cytochrome c subunit
MKNAFQFFVSLLLCHWLAGAGAVMVTSSAAVFLTFAFRSFSNPYYGLIVFLVVPAFFVVGLLMVPLGIWRCSRRKGGLRNIPRSDIAGPRSLQFFGLIAVLTMVNLAMVSAATYGGAQYMDSNEFCGTVCHSIMSPHYVAYQDSPHSRVECVTCHVGPGAEWVVHYKLSGIRQLYGAVFDNFSRPIPPAIRSLRPSEDTCEQCHSPARIGGDKLKVIRRYEEDEKNTETVSVLLMRTGSRIHKAHVGADIEYAAADPANQDIPWVSAGGVVFKSAEAVGERRKMDCVDCHNRATHVFDMPGPAVDRALASGELDRSIPYLKRDALLALAGEKPLDPLPAAVKRIYDRNIHPQMMISWGVYPNNIGHDAFPGCFRCHDDHHKSDTGATISQDCSSCHELLAISEQNPEILTTLGLQ